MKKKPIPVWPIWVIIGILIFVGLYLGRPMQTYLFVVAAFGGLVASLLIYNKNEKRVGKRNWKNPRLVMFWSICSKPPKPTPTWNRIIQLNILLDWKLYKCLPVLVSPLNALPF